VLYRADPLSTALHAVAMYGSPYHVVLILDKLPDLFMSVFDSSMNAADNAVMLSRNPDGSPSAVHGDNKNNEHAAQRVEGVLLRRDVSA
jgi:hypothetical protein